MFCIGYTRTWLVGLHEEILGIVEFHEVGSTLLEGLHDETFGCIECHVVGIA